jgi:two-component system chemotaxis response regulator CheB
MIRVLVAAGSIILRERLVALLSADPEIEVVGQATHRSKAVDAAKRLRPDVIAIDVHLPDSGGLDVTKEIMTESPTAIVIVSDETDARQVELSILALRAGALAVVPRPAIGSGLRDGASLRFLSTVKAMSEVKLVRRWRDRPSAKTTDGPWRGRNGVSTRIVALAASTGGPAAIQQVLAELPPDFSPPILVVQHIAKGFVDGLVDWLNSLCSLKVKLATDGEPLARHTVYLAPDDQHLGVKGPLQIMLSRSPPIGGFCPSATFLFDSVAKAFGPSSVHVILTGMGQDGVAGLKVAHAEGARIIAQDEATSVVFGMPGAAVEAGVVDNLLPLGAVAQELVTLARN